MTANEKTPIDLVELKTAASKALNALDLENAAGLYSRALEAEGLAPQERFELLSARAECWRRLARFQNEIEDLQELSRLAASMGNLLEQARVTEWLSQTLFLGDDYSAAEEAVSSIQALVGLSDDPELNSELELIAACSLGFALSSSGRYPESLALLEKALQKAQERNDDARVAQIRYYMGSCYWRIGRLAEAENVLNLALDFYRKSGDATGEGNVCFRLATISSSPEEARLLLDRAMTLFQSVGLIERQHAVYNNLLVLYTTVGNFNRGLDCARRAIEIGNRIERYSGSAYIMGNLIEIYFQLGQYDQALEVASQASEYIAHLDDPNARLTYFFNHGLAHLAAGEFSEALEKIQEAWRIIKESEVPAEATVLAWFAAAWLALGEIDQALASSARAVEIRESRGQAQGAPDADTWWWRYRALTQQLGQDEPLPEEAWLVLDHAREDMLARAADVSDAGFLRSYFSNIRSHRLLIPEWIRRAKQRGLPLDPLIDHLKAKTDLAPQLQRLLEVGARMNAQSDLEALPTMIMDEIVELTGAERAALMLVDSEHGSQPAAVRLPAPSLPTILVPGQPDPGVLDETTFLRQIAPLIEQTEQKRAGQLLYLPSEGDELEQRSVLCVPMLVQGRLIGLIYAELSGVYGRLEGADLDLLTVLANQAAVAVENASWARTLEQRVEQRTDELKSANERLEQRNAELAIINSIQQGLASELDFQGIVDNVGDRLRQVFNTDDLYITWYDDKKNLVHRLYIYEHGKRLAIPPGPPLYKNIAEWHKKRQPLLFRNPEECAALGLQTVPGTDTPKSGMSMPIIGRDRVIGTLGIENYERENAFDEDDVRLLQTITASLGVALENARLFEETQDLLEETRQRTAELTIINSVSEAVSRQLNVDAILKIVGDKVREIFAADVTQIAIYDPENNLNHSKYSYDHGYLPEETSPFGSGLVSRIITSRQPILTHTQEESDRLGALKVPDAQGEPDQTQSFLGVPIIVGERVLGVVNVQSYRAHAYDEAGLRLLQTMASSMGVALENARLYQEIQRRVEEMATLAEIGGDIASTHELEPVLSRLAVRVKDLLQIRDIAFYLVDEENNVLMPVAALGKYVEETLSSPIQVGRGITGDIAVTGRAEIINDSVHDPRVVHITGTSVEEEEQEIIMIAPLISRGKVIGTINVWREKTGGLFVQQDLDFLVSVARQAAIAIESARLYVETVRHADQMAMVAEIGREMAVSLDMDTLLDHMATRLHAIFNARDTIIRLAEPDGEHFRAVAAVGEYAENFRASTIRLGEGLSGSIAQSGVAEIVAEPSKDPRGVHVSGTPEEETDPTTAMIAPLLSQGRAIGLILLYRAKKDGRFTQVDLDFLVALARQAASAVENARLFSEMQQRTRETLATSEILRIISSSPGDLQPVLDAVARKAVEVCETEDALILLKSGDHMQPVASYGPYETESGRRDLVPLDRKTIGGRAMIDRQIVHVPDLLKEPDEEYGLAREINDPQGPEGLRSFLSAPLIIEGEAIGSILLRRRQAGTFSERQIDLLKTFADQAVIAIENTRHIAEIENQRQYFQSLVEISPVAIVTVDLDFRVISWNPAARALFGYTAEEAIGRNIYELHSQDEAIRQESARLGNEIKDGKHIRAITRRTRKDGSPVEVEISGVPVTVAGKQMGNILIYHDITELIEARRQAEEANQAKSAFLAMMSHEIRTPMNAIIGMSGLLLDTPLNTEQQEFALIIRDSGDSLLTIINDILDFSKIEAEKMALERHPFELQECVESALDLVAPRAADKRIDLAYTIEDGVPLTLVGDVTRVRQILLNLLSNAVKFTEQGEVVVTVTSQPADQDGRHVEGAASQEGSHLVKFAVSDTGIGVPAERMDRLFQSFSQVDVSTSRKYGGTGLGLVISKRLSEMMGGEITAESQVGKGSTFAFTILAQEGEKSASSRRDLRGAQPHLEGRRVLVVDDNDTNRRILSLQLAKWGMLVRDTPHPQEALRWLESGEPAELAILDMHMPEMDGLELAGKIRRLRSRQELPLFMFSSLGRRETGTEGLEVEGWLTKPLKPSSLFDSVSQVFAEKKPARPAASAPASRVQFDAQMAIRHPLRILLAEDNAVNQKLALRLLSLMGYRADVAGNGLEAIQALERQDYDLVLMDVQMPEMDGLEASRQINQRWPQRPPLGRRPTIIAMTANAMQEDRELCLAAGMDDYISKPVRNEELIAALERTPAHAADKDRQETRKG